MTALSWITLRLATPVISIAPMFSAEAQEHQEGAGKSAALVLDLPPGLAGQGCALSFNTRFAHPPA